MPLKVNNLVDQKTYFVSQSSAILYEEKTGIKKQAVNHLLLGDWLKYVGEKHVHKWTTSKGENKSITFAKVRARGYDGWLKLEDFDEERSLEVNFVDIGQGDGCHIVTPDDKVLVIDAGIADNMDRFLS